MLQGRSFDRYRGTAVGLHPRLTVLIMTVVTLLLLSVAYFAISERLQHAKPVYQDAPTIWLIPTPEPGLSPA